jgi:hypothetical protein
MTATTRWLAKARITDDPEGDLIEDMRRDAKANGELPLFKNIHAMPAYLQQRRLPRGAASRAPRVATL